jgi:hypothetical protein
MEVAHYLGQLRQISRARIPLEARVFAAIFILCCNKRAYTIEEIKAAATQSATYATYAMFAIRTEKYLRLLAM